VVILYISPHFGILYQEKSGSPDVAAISVLECLILQVLLPPSFRNCHLLAIEILELDQVCLHWDRCYDFLNIFAEKFSEKLAFLTQNNAKF
jgi:hypothetical protein